MNWINKSLYDMVESIHILSTCCIEINASKIGSQTALT